MNRLARLIEQLDLEELKLIRRDLQAGTIERLISQRIEKLETRKMCPTCGRELGPGDQKYSIEFGPSDLRQKAHFDELDCLDYFLEKLRDKRLDAPAATRGDSDPRWRGPR